MKSIAALLACLATANADTGLVSMACRNGELVIYTPVPVRQIALSYADIMRVCQIPV